MDFLPEQEQILTRLPNRLAAFGLGPLWQWIKHHHTKDLGYHNRTHLKVVAAVAAHLADLNGSDIRLAIIAGMFHDFQHTGEGPDSKNVKIAIAGLRRAWSMRIVDLTDAEFRTVQHAILCTTYEDGQFLYEPISALEEAVRDADLWNINLNPTNARHMILGLGRELGLWNATTLGHGIDLTEQFLSKVIWYTAEGQAHSVHVRTRLNVIRSLDPSVAYVQQYYEAQNSRGHPQTYDESGTPVCLQCHNSVQENRGEGDACSSCRTVFLMECEHDNL